MKVSEAVHVTHSFQNSDAKPKRIHKNCEKLFY